MKFFQRFSLFITHPFSTFMLVSAIHLHLNRKIILGSRGNRTHRPTESKTGIESLDHCPEL